MSTTFKDLPVRSVFTTPRYPTLPRVKVSDSTCCIPRESPPQYATIDPATVVWPAIRGSEAARAVYSDGCIPATPPTQEDITP